MTTDPDQRQFCERSEGHRRLGFSQRVRVPGYRLLGAFVESPGGNVFIKFTGSAKTMAANQPKFQQLLNSFEKAGK
jgi:hypothetical protein